MTTRLKIPSVPLIVLLFILFGPLLLSAAVTTSVLHSMFEPQRQEGGARFVWRGADVHVVLDRGAEVEFRSGPSVRGSGILRMRFAGADSRSNPQAEAAGQIPVRFYTASDPAGTLRPWFRTVRYHNLYPGVDLIFRGEGTSLEYDFELGPRADPALIRLDYGATVPQLKDNGDLELRAGSLTVIQKQPKVYQVANGVRVPVLCRYLVTVSGTVALALGNYDPARSLTIDPVLTFNTTLGGPGYDAAYAMVYTAGGIYIAGETGSVSLSGSGTRSSRDAFVAKLDPTGSTLLYATYFGGNGMDSARALAVDASGNAYVAGATNSTDFPTTAGAIGTTNQGLEDAFVMKVNSVGARVYSTLMGSATSDYALAIAVDTSGDAYIAGQTGGSFPVTSSAAQKTFKGGTDCFVSKLNSTGTALAYSTLLGGTQFDGCRGIALDASGDAYVTGVTYSSNFPITAGAEQTSLKGIADVFITKINPTGATVLYSTFLGGTNYDEGNAIVVDSSGAAYVAGDTMSTDFPVTSGSAQTTNKGGYDAFVAKLSATGATLSYATLIGGSGSDAANAIALDSANRAVVAGYTSSMDFPVARAAQTAYGGAPFDAFAAVVDPYGSSLLFSSYLGGVGDDRAYAVAAGSGTSIYLAGTTQSPDFPKTAGGTVTAGNSDVFVAEMTYTLPTTSGYLFVPVVPTCRVVNTQDATFGSVFGPPYLAGGWYSTGAGLPKTQDLSVTRTFPIPSGNCGVPFSAKAYSLNVTVIPRGSVLEWLTVWPAGQSMPTASTLNAYDGRTVSNSTLMPAGSGGVSIWASEATDIWVDVNGYFVDPSMSTGLYFYTMTPGRITDTRTYTQSGYSPAIPSSLGPPYLSTGVTRTFPVAQSPYWPSAAQAYSLNITVMPTSGTLQSLEVWPTGATQPSVATVSSVNGQIVAGAAIVAASTSGSLNFMPSNNTDILFDINGYFAGLGAGGLSFTPVTPCRVLDTRTAADSPVIGPSTTATRSVDVLGNASSRCSLSIPSTARAYSTNITAFPVKTLPYLTAWPTGSSRPVVSTLNSYNGQTLANAAIVPAGIGGMISIYNDSDAHVIVDINGYFAP